MKKQFSQIIILIVLCVITITSYSQITRGAVPGEIYISTFWYVDNIGQLHYVILHSTDNGEQLSPQYNNLETPPPGEMKIGRVLDDATPGALYNYDNYGHIGLWVSFDYGESWEYRDDYSYAKYASGFYDGEIYRRSNYNLYRSNNYGETFEIIVESLTAPLSDVGNQSGELFGFTGSASIAYNLYHSIDYGYNFNMIPIDSTVAFWAPYGLYPKISRGTEPGELYLVSWWLDSKYKIFHSVDTGYTWTQQYESDSINIYYWGLSYTAGKEPGSFYVVRGRLDPTFTHAMVYIDYSSDYGKTFTTYFHNLTPNFTSIATNEIVTVNLSNYPNPFTNSTTIQFNLPKNAKNPILSIYNIYGKLIIQYNITNKTSQQWDGMDENGRVVHGGIYLYQISYGSNYSPTKKMLFIQ